MKVSFGKRMNNKGLLDCTLRDGGYVNDWNFGHSVIVSTYKRLDDAGVEFIEVGFLDERRPFDLNRTISPNTQGFNEIFKGVEKKHAIPVAMIDFGTCGIDNIQNSCDTFIEGIRVIFKKEKIKDALPFCKAIKEKGYKLFIQAISITSYSDVEMLNYVKDINDIEPYAFSIVDTYGLLDDRLLKNYFYLIDKNLSPRIKIGYHAHNNFQLAFSNSMIFLALETNRDIVVDSTVYGMGKSAGNTATELIALHMNERYGCKYNINQVLEIFDTDLMPIYERNFWGYKYNFYISARHKCHPNYVTYLLNKKTLSITSINDILCKIQESKKLYYDEPLIESLYIQYQSSIIDDSSSIENIKKELNGKTILLLGPGTSLIKEKEYLGEFININNPAIIAVNFIPHNINFDFIFISNSKRYGQLTDEFIPYKSKLILTSNIVSYDRPGDYTFNYSELLIMNCVKSDNSLLLLLAALSRCDVKYVYLAGFDGFEIDSINYYDQKYDFGGNKEYVAKLNSVIAQGLKNLSSKITISFITSSIYETLIKQL